MNNHSSLLRLCKIFCLVLTLGAGMNACATTRTFTWKEEVLLHDGKKIVVERSDTYDSSLPHEIGQGPPLVEHKTTFMIPGTIKAVIWKSDYGRSSDADSFHFLALDFLDGVPYVATRPAKCPTYDKWNRPNPPYVFFKYVDEWKYISLPEFPEQFRINVIVTSRKIDNPRIVEAHSKFGFVPAQTVAAINREPGRSKEFYTLFREPIDLFGVCPEPTGPDGRPVKK